MIQLRRIMVVAENGPEDVLAAKSVEFGASGYTPMPCHGDGRAMGGIPGTLRVSVFHLAEAASILLRTVRLERGNRGRGLFGNLADLEMVHRPPEPSCDERTS